MRLTGLAVQGFRGFAGKQSIDLDADVVVVVAANGQGKTSLMGAILWGLAGAVPRLGSDDTVLLSLYSQTGMASVTVELRDGEERLFRVTRSYDGVAQHVTVVNGDQTLRGVQAQAALMKKLWPDVFSSSDETAALTRALTRSIYLQQDAVRQFVDADSEQERFAGVSELVGAGRISELQLQLERARTAWTRATNVRVPERDELAVRVSRVSSMLDRLVMDANDGTDEFDVLWREWLTDVRRAEIEVDASTAVTSSSIASVSNVILNQLEAHRRAAERRRLDLNNIAIEIQHRSAPDPTELALAKRRLVEADAKASAAREALRMAERRSADLREASVRSMEAQAQIKALAQLALGQLAETCPVCQQQYDIEVTRARLLAVVADVSHTVTALDDFSVALASRDVTAAEELAAATREDVRLAQQKANEWSVWLKERDLRILDMAISTDTLDLRASVRMAEEALARTIEVLTELIARGEGLSLKLARVAEFGRRAELESEGARVSEELDSLNSLIGSREATGALATRVLDGLRDAAAKVVADRLLTVEPLLQRLYTGIDPHPCFRAVKLLTTFSRGRGHLSARLDDSIAKVVTETPAAVLSSSQMNALAVCVFLALNLGIPNLPLETVILDDPLQSLDDVNLLGLVDLLRRVKVHRQLIVSTHDEQFGELLARKLRPVDSSQRTTVIKMGGWNRLSQSVIQTDCTLDRPALRIVA